MSTPQLLSKAVNDAADLLRGEITLAKAEIQQSVDDAKASAGMFGVAGVMAAYGGIALVGAAVAGLAVVVDVWLAALIVAVVLFIVAGVAAAVGKKKADNVSPPLDRSKVNVQRDIETVKETRS